MGRSKGGARGEAEGYQIKVRRIARREVEEAHDYFEEQQEGLGKDFEQEAVDLFERVRRLPLAHTEVAPGVRRALIFRFRYAVYYAIRGRTIQVLGVIHQHRAEAVWQSRVRQWLEKNP